LRTNHAGGAAAAAHAADDEIPCGCSVRTTPWPLKCLQRSTAPASFFALSWWPCASAWEQTPERRRALRNGTRVLSAGLLVGAPSRRHSSGHFQAAARRRLARRMGNARGSCVFHSRGTVQDATRCCQRRARTSPHSPLREALSGLCCVGHQRPARHVAIPTLPNGDFRRTHFHAADKPVQRAWADLPRHLVETLASNARMTTRPDRSLRRTIDLILRGFTNCAYAAWSLFDARGEHSGPTPA
jgi:hypothetical protein